MIPVSPDSRNRLLNAGKALAFFLAYIYGIKALSLVLGPFAHDLPPLLAPFVILGFIAFTAALISLCFLAGERRPFASLGFRMGGLWFQDWGLGFLGGMALMGVCTGALALAGGFHWERNPEGTLGGVAMGLGIFILGGLHEELAFRGYGFQRLVQALGPWPAQIILGALFGIWHLGNPGISTSGPGLRAVTTLNIALAAVLMGLCYLRTRSLALPIGLHIGWNWAQGNLLGFAVSGTTRFQGLWKPVLHARPDWLTGGAVGLEGSIFCTVFCLGAIVALSRWKGRPEASPEEPDPAQDFLSPWEPITREKQP